ncbi:hypothetical protein [Streptomyces sp. NPDC002057]|uniref:hypothetical protein n=1 Tax=Streptomyces sp. NPDC002057 TaxID=3154664 RepID=UPI00332F6569
MSAAEAGVVFRELRGPMEAADFLTRGLYREQRATRDGSLLVFGLGEATVAGANACLPYSRPRAVPDRRGRHRRRHPQ